MAVSSLNLTKKNSHCMYNMNILFELIMQLNYNERVKSERRIKIEEIL